MNTCVGAAQCCEAGAGVGLEGSTYAAADAGVGVGGDGDGKHGAHPVGDCRHCRKVACHAHPVGLDEPEPDDEDDSDDERSGVDEYSELPITKSC